MEVERGSRKTYAAVLCGGLAAVGLAAYVRYLAQMQAYRGALAFTQGNDLGLSGMSNGLFGSILGAMLVGTVILVTVVIACYATLDLRAGLAMALLCLLPVTLFNVLVTRFLLQYPELVAKVPSTTAAYPGQAFSSLREVLMTASIGMLIGYFASRHRADVLASRAFKVPLPSRAERAAIDAEYERRKQLARANPVAPGVMPEPEAPPVPAGLMPPVTVPAEEKRAVICRGCGASNAPVRTHCLRCGAAIAS
jgi:uncharacterized membrane protein